MTVGSCCMHTHLPRPQEGQFRSVRPTLPPEVPSRPEFQLLTLGATAPLLAAFPPCLISPLSYQYFQGSLLKGTTGTRVCCWEKPH